MADRGRRSKKDAKGGKKVKKTLQQMQQLGPQRQMQQGLQQQMQQGPQQQMQQGPQQQMQQAPQQQMQQAPQQQMQQGPQQQMQQAPQQQMQQAPQQQMQQGPQQQMQQGPQQQMQQGPQQQMQQAPQQQMQQGPQQQMQQGPQQQMQQGPQQQMQQLGLQQQMQQGPQQQMQQAPQQQMQQAPQQQMQHLGLQQQMQQAPQKQMQHLGLQQQMQQGPQQQMQQGPQQQMQQGPQQQMQQDPQQQMQQGLQQQMQQLGLQQQMQQLGLQQQMQQLGPQQQMQQAPQQQMQQAPQQQMQHLGLQQQMQQAPQKQMQHLGLQQQMQQGPQQQMQQGPQQQMQQGPQQQMQQDPQQQMQQGLQQQMQQLGLQQQMQQLGLQQQMQQLGPQQQMQQGPQQQMQQDPQQQMQQGPQQQMQQDPQQQMQQGPQQQMQQGPQQQMQQGPQQQMQLQSPQTEVLLHVVDVRQALAIVVQVGTGTDSKWYLYDAGSYGNLEKTLKKLQPQTQWLDGAIISHPHNDHYRGLQTLLTKPAAVAKPESILITEAFTETCVPTLLNLINDQYKFQINVQAPFFNNQRSFHFFFDRNVPHVGSRFYTRNSNQNLNANADASSDISDTLSTTSVNEDRKPPSSNVNHDSIVMQIGDNHPILLTGDAPSFKIAELVGAQGPKRLSVYQVPHHGARKFDDLKDEKPKVYPDDDNWINNAARLLAIYEKRPKEINPAIETFGKHTTDQLNRMFKTSKEELTWKPIPLDSVPNLNELQEFKACADRQVERLILLEGILRWARFYHRTIQADLYVISAGESRRLRHPSPEVINGIIIASMWQKQDCRIALTNNGFWKLHGSQGKTPFPKEVQSVASATIWYLNTLPTPSNSQTSFFTIIIDQWCTESSSTPTIWIKHSPCKQTGLHKEELRHAVYNDNIQVNINSARASGLNRELSANTGERLGNSRDPELSEYLQSIGYPGDKTQLELSTVLKCLLGPQVASQLGKSLTVQPPQEMVPAMLEWKVREDSSFDLTCTGTAATSATIKLGTASSKEGVHEATLEIKNARTPNMEAHLTLNVTRSLKAEDGCGQTLADYLYCRGCTEWELAKQLKVGEVLFLLFGEARACSIIQSLPVFLSIEFIQWKLQHYLTTVSIGSDRVVKYAHIYMDTQSTSLSVDEIRLTFKSLVLHVYPSHDKYDQGIQLEGECEVNGKYEARITSAYTSDLPIELKLTFIDQLSVMKAAQVVGARNVHLGALKFTGEQLTECEQLSETSTYEAGFMIAQSLPSTKQAELSSFFFATKFNPDSLKGLLPDALSSLNLDNVEVCSSVHYPHSDYPKLGLAVSFTLNLELSGDKKTVSLDCSFSALPSRYGKQEYFYSLLIKPYYRPDELQDVPIEGASVYDIITAISKEIGKPFKEAISKIPSAESVDASKTPSIGEQIMKSISLKKLALQISLRRVEAVVLDVSLSSLEIIPGKITMSNGRLLASYSDGTLQLECSGNLTFFDKFTTAVEFVLPTSQSDGMLYFENYDDQLTLSELLKGFGWLSEGIESIPILSDFLKITVRKLYIVFGISSEGRLQISEAEISLYLNELNISIVTFSMIELDVKLSKQEGRYQVYFSIGAYIAEKLYIQLDYDPENRWLTGQVHVTSFSQVEAPDTLNTFKVEAGGSSFDKLKDSLTKEFSELFRSSGDVKKPPLTASASITIGLPSEESPGYTLEQISLCVKDALQIGKCVLDTLSFEYSKTPFSEETKSSIRLLGTLRKINSDESVTVVFDLDAHRAESSTFTATVMSGGLLKLRSLLELAGVECPELPNKMPPIFEMELVQGSISFQLTPKFRVHGFDVTVGVNEDWQLFDDPEIIVHDLYFTAAWKSKSDSPELTFTGSSIFMSTELTLRGRIKRKEVLVNAECQSLPQKPGDTQALVPNEEYEPDTSSYFHGSGTLFVGCLPKQPKMSYIFTLSLHEFTFSKLSRYMAFVDDVITIRDVNLLVSSVDACRISDILQPYEDAFSSELQPQKPFSTLPALVDPQLTEKLQKVNRGITLYAAIDLNACKDSESLLSNVIELGGEDSPLADIIMSVSISKGSAIERTSSSFEFYAWIPKLALFRMVTFSDIEMSYIVNKDPGQGNSLNLKGTGAIEVPYIRPEPFIFEGNLNVTNIQAHLEVKISDVIDRPAGLSIKMNDLKVELDVPFKKKQRGKKASVVKQKAPVMKIHGAIELTTMLRLRGYVFLEGTSLKLFRILLCENFEFSMLIERVISDLDWSAITLDITVKKGGHFYYAGKDTAIMENDELVQYKQGYHLECTVKVLDTDFAIGAHIVRHGKSKTIILSGHSVEKIPFGFAKFTSRDFKRGPELEYKDKTLSLYMGVEIFGLRLFAGHIGYSPKDKTFQGGVWLACVESIPMLKDLCTMEVSWSRSKKARSKFNIIKFPFSGENSLFNLLGAFARFAKAIYNLVQGYLAWHFRLEMRTGTKDDPDIMVQLILQGIIFVTIIGFFDIDLIPLPEIPLNFPWPDPKEGFTFKKLPQYMVKALKASGPDIVKSVLNYLHPFNLAKMMGKVLVDAVVGVVKQTIGIVKDVVSIGKTIWKGAKAVWKGFKWLTGHSTLIHKNGNVICYISGGKGGKKLKNESYTVEYYGGFLALLGVGEISSDVCTNAKACMDLQGHESMPSSEENGEAIERTDLVQWKKDSEKLTAHMKVGAQEMLTVKDISICIQNMKMPPDTSSPCLAMVIIKWKVCNEEGETVHSNDAGDIDHHLKVTATKLITDGGQNSIEEEVIFDQSLTVYVKTGDDQLGAIVLLTEATLKQCIYIGVSICPSITATVKAPNDKMKLDEAHLDIQGDGIDWTDIKKTIDDPKKGRMKEVTLYGKKAYEEHLITKSVFHDPIQITPSYNHKEQSITVRIPMEETEATDYLIRVTDISDPTLVTKHMLLPVDPKTEYTIDMSDLPADSHGPYSVSALGLYGTKDGFETGESFMVFNWSLCRHNPPKLLEHIFDGSTVKVTWSPPSDGTAVEYKYCLIGTINIDATRDYSESLNREYSFGSEEPDQEITPNTFHEVRVAKCQYELDLTKILTEEQANSEITLYSVVTTAGDSDKLPSIPISSLEFTVLAPPPKVKISIPENEAGLLVSWCCSTNALSYRLEIVTVDQSKEYSLKTKTVTLEKIIRVPYKEYHTAYLSQKVIKSRIKSRIEGYDTEAMVSMKDLRSLPFNGKYKVRLYALGFGDELLTSLKPTWAEEKIHVLPDEIKLKYSPHLEKILVENQPSDVGYTVEFYLWKEGRKHLLASSSQEDQSPPQDSLPWRSELQDGWANSTISGWVYYTDPKAREIHIGIARVELIFQTPLKTNEMSEGFSQISMSWPECIGNTQEYEYGICDDKSNTYYAVFKTRDCTSAVIDLSTVEKPPPSYIQFKCFVRCLGDTFITVFSAATYQCIVPASPDTPTVVYLSVSLCKLWTSHLITITCQYMVVPQRQQKRRYIVLPHESPFPEIPHEMETLFWKSNAQTLPDNGYLYAYDKSCLTGLVSGSVKHKLPRKIDLDPITTEKPTCWHKEMHLLIILRCSSLPGTEPQGTLKCELKQLLHPIYPLSATLKEVQPRVDDKPSPSTTTQSTEPMATLEPKVKHTVDAKPPPSTATQSTVTTVTSRSGFHLREGLKGLKEGYQAAEGRGFQYRAREAGSHFLKGLRGIKKTSHTVASDKNSDKEGYDRKKSGDLDSKAVIEERKTAHTVFSDKPVATHHSIQPKLRRKCIKIDLQSQRTDETDTRNVVCLIGHICIRLEDYHTLSLVISGEQCRCDDVHLYVRFV